MNPSVEGDTTGIVKYSEFGPIKGYILETVQDGSKLVLVTNRKSRRPISVRLVPKSMTLNDLEWRNGRYFCVISANSLTFGAHCVKLLEDVPKLFATGM